MSFNLQHLLVSTPLEVTENSAPGGGVFFAVAAQGDFNVLYPGRLSKRVLASVRHSMRIDTPSTDPPPLPPVIDGGPSHPPSHPSPTPDPLHGGVQVTVETFPVALRIFTPQGEEFSGQEVTLADLRKYRDLRGVPVGHWRYTLSGRSRTYTPVAALNETVTDPKGLIELAVIETVPSQSAPPLVAGAPLDGSRQSFSFDLYRVGTFVARIDQSSPDDPWHGSMSLFDPDGVRVAGTAHKELRVAVPLALLGKSRDPAGSHLAIPRPAVRPWTLQVSPQGGTVVGSPRVTAMVLGEGRIGTTVLRDRIARLIGPGGSFIQLVGENAGGKARARLTITDVVAAETIDMHGLLDSRLEKEEEPKDLEAGKPVTLYSRSEDLDHGLRLDVSSIRLESLDLDVGPGRGLGADTPVLRLVISAAGKVKVKFGPLTLADAALRDGKAVLEIGLKIEPDGTPRIAAWTSDDPFDIDLNNGVLAALIATLGLAGGITAQVITEYVEHVINDTFSEGLKELFDDPVLAPKLLMTIMGTHLTYRPVRFDGDDILFEHVAPAEPDVLPRLTYAGAIGRTPMIEGPGLVRFHPRTLGDTWKADNLINKIQHIVVVMMENRSYDHVLGYRAQPPISDGADGLSQEVIDAIQATPEQHKVRPLREAGFPPNAVGKMTRIPKGVGHEREDVAQQLAGRISGPDGRQINDPKGFADNFRENRLKGDPEGCVPDDVLGFYDAEDLPIFGHLAENYAYCDRYYCSHPGPTLPNRMYSLTGDVQHDRLGVPILDNNHGDNFLLSRAESIYDFLTKQGVSWRVYESAPSVTMLRMFARYATNDTDIRPIDRLEADIAVGDLPSFVAIEPAMHHHPQDDDHPDADMHRGQMFIRRVYEALRSKPEIWRNTLLIVTYDEHGGLYDHVVPPTADIFRPARSGGAVADPLIVADAGGSSTGGGSTSVGGHGLPGRLGDVLGHLDNVLVATDAPDNPPAQPPDPTIQIPYGVRVPTFVVSPWTARGKGPSITLDHCSILKTVLARFGNGHKPVLSDRVSASLSFESFLTETAPRMDVGPSPELEPLPITVRAIVPGASQIITPTISRRRLREGQVDYHDISGFVARMLGR
jgi:phospholipase C